MQVKLLIWVLNKGLFSLGGVPGSVQNQVILNGTPSIPELLRILVMVRFARSDMDSDAFIRRHLSYSLNFKLLKRCYIGIMITYGGIIGTIKGDTSSLYYSSSTGMGANGNYYRVYEGFGYISGNGKEHGD